MNQMQYAFVRDRDSDKKIVLGHHTATLGIQLARGSPLSARQSSRWEKRSGGRFLSREPLPHGALCSNKSTRAAADSRLA